MAWALLSLHLEKPLERTNVYDAVRPMGHWLVDFVRTRLPSFRTPVLGRLTRRNALGKKMVGKKMDVLKESGIRIVGVWAD